MEIPLITIHITPLDSLPKKFDLPLRIIFLSEAIKGFMSTKNIDVLYHRFIDEKDFEGASAAAGAGVASIWDSGSDFKRYEAWDKRIDQLLKKDISALARASLFGFKALIEITYKGDVSAAKKVLDSQLFWAEKANSNSLRVFNATVLGYCYSYSGDFQRFEVVAVDTIPISEAPETSFICKIYFKLIQGLFRVIKREISEGKRILLEAIDHPFFEKLPPSISLLGYGHLLLTAAFEGDINGVEIISKKIQERVVPEHNHFHQGYAHFDMGIASLVLDKPYKALLHGQQVAEKGRLCQSPIPERLSALLIGQALSDMGRIQEALDHFLPWLEKWEKSGYQMFAMHGYLEVSNILLKKGKLEEARKYYEKAIAMLPKGEQIPILYRPPEFFQNLKQSLYPEPLGVREWLDQGDRPINIQTFGELCVRKGDQVLYDRKWRGGRSKAILKALIVYGGTKVSENLLIDTLWPDVDGDLAMNNLKVALSRLRRIGCEKGEEPLPWIVVRHRHVSMLNSLCSVDSIRFKNALSIALKSKNKIENLTKVLDLYKDDFLVNDSELWIVRHRELLREDFIKGVLTLSEQCIEIGKGEEAIPYLDKAIEKDPLNEVLYATLMRIYLKMGYPSRAIKVFQRAKEILKKELNIDPGSKMISLLHEASRRQ